MTAAEYDNHIKILAWVNIGLSLVLLFLGLFALLFLGGLGVATGDPEAIPILGTIGTMALLFFGAFALPGFAAGYGLLKKTWWARPVTVIVAVLDLFNVPIGTAIGVYAFWLLTHEQAAAYFDQS